MATIKEHFLNVQDLKLREVLIHNMYYDQADLPVRDLAQAIMHGFEWSDERVEPKNNGGARAYWERAYKDAQINNIPLINPDLS